MIRWLTDLAEISARPLEYKTGVDDEEIDEASSITIHRSHAQFNTEQRTSPHQSTTPFVPKPSGWWKTAHID